MKDMSRIRDHFPKRLVPVFLLVFFLGPMGPAEQSQSSSPYITRLELQGKRLMVTGVNFDETAVIQLEGERQRTRSDPDSPTTLLMAKRAGSNIGNASPTGITVRNHSGLISNTLFIYKTESFSAQYVLVSTLPTANINNDHLAALLLKPDEYFIVDLGGLPGFQNPNIQTGDPGAILQPLVQDPFMPVFEKYLYRVTGSGTVGLTFTATFDSPPPFPPPVLNVLVTVE
jgi:hypothetical protein